jgi:hypothetical protein
VIRWRVWSRLWWRAPLCFDRPTISVSTVRGWHLRSGVGSTSSVRSSRDFLEGVEFHTDGTARVLFDSGDLDLLILDLQSAARPDLPRRVRSTGPTDLVAERPDIGDLPRFDDLPFTEVTDHGLVHPEAPAGAADAAEVSH